MENKERIIQALSACASTCDECADACSKNPYADELNDSIALSKDCAAICRLALACVSEGSENTNDVLLECAAICERCAEMCDRHQTFYHCRQCADACRACIASCIEFPALAG